MKLSVKDRVKDLISRITDADKPNLLTARGKGGNGQHMQALPELGVPAYYWVIMHSTRSHTFPPSHRVFLLPNSLGRALTVFTR
jgi:hypothetical protein